MKTRIRKPEVGKSNKLPFVQEGAAEKPRKGKPAATRGDWSQAVRTREEKMHKALGGEADYAILPASKGTLSHRFKR